jgi:hypothetical protein
MQFKSELCYEGAMNSVASCGSNAAAFCSVITLQLLLANTFPTLRAV